MIGRTPFSFVRRMMEDMDRLFDDFAGRSEEGFLQPFGALTQVVAWNPQIEVVEKNGNLLVRADLPGLRADDVDVELADDALVIQGERKNERESSEGGVYHTERVYGSFVRRIPLPRGVDASSCDAKFENGVLEVTLKMPKSAKRSIEVRSGAQGGQQPSAQEQQPKSGTIANGPQSSPPH
jgi:HSP20 family protein